MILQNVNTLALNDPYFPPALKHTQPPVGRLYWTGQPPVEWLKLPKVAIVGSRKFSAYGQAVTERLSRELAAHGVVIISGLALGVDSIAHRAALGAGGCTVAVLPTALNNVYPATHLDLANQIINRGGTLISEYSDTDEVYKINFVARNRIVSGLADILLITEAAVNSGTMHTARFALEQGKTVMAVPGNITAPGSEGCNNLIKSGAVAVTDTSDVLFALGFKPVKKRSSVTGDNLTSVQTEILKLIASGVDDQELLAQSAQLGGSELFAALTGLELAGAVRPLGAGRWTVA